jgi:hypothetical protein
MGTGGSSPGGCKGSDTTSPSSVNTDEEMETEYWWNNEIKFLSKEGNVLAYGI